MGEMRAMPEYIDKEALLMRMEHSPLFANPKDTAWLKSIKLGVLDLIERQPAVNAEHCVCCGEVVPEGRQVCQKCERSV